MPVDPFNFKRIEKMSFLRSVLPVRSPRHDLYVGIHKGLRAFMCETLRRVGSMDPDDDAELAETLDAVSLLLDFCRSHIEHEDAVIHPALEAHRAGAAQQAEEEHADHRNSLAIISAQVAQLRDSHGAARARAALRLYRLLAILVGENFLHMHMEETDHNESLWAACSDAELVALEQRIHALIAPAEMALALRWMIPAMTPAERLAVMRPLGEAVPQGVFETLLADLRPHLDARALAKLESGLRRAA